MATREQEGVRVEEGAGEKPENEEQRTQEWNKAAMLRPASWVTLLEERDEED